MSKKRNILIVDDEEPTISSLEVLLSDDFHLIVARNGEEALRKIQGELIDLVFLDITLPGMNGFDVLKKIKEYDETIDVVMLTADETARTAMRAMELGAFHYITKPYDNDDILLITRRVFEKKHMAEEIVSLRDEVEGFEAFHNIVGQNPKMKEVYHLITKVAAADSTVLITGESGTGKELVARAIHTQSPRCEKNFKAINCGAIPEHLLESELFGHEKGAFTGASERKIGKFEMATDGTLLLDEISAMKENLQIKLLRVLQEHEIERVGGTKSIPVDVRIIAATNSNLKQLVETGQFREDLFYRINVIHIHLPPLRERESDILLLADHFLKLFSRKFAKAVEGWTEGAKSLLLEYPWPGNVRELRNVMERAVVLSDGGPVRREQLPLDLSLAKGDLPQDTSPFSLKQIMDSYEKKVLLCVLERAGWNQSQASQMLGIHRNTLLGKLSMLGIDVKKLKRGQEDVVYS